jgi:glutathione S-transferase
MVFVTPTTKSVFEMNGLHLYHANRSNCSARVRLLFEEKGLDWTSHHIDLGTKENISEEYFGINPKGVVPALVHDGTVVTESNDILLYLEEKYPEPGFRAVADEHQSYIDYWLKVSGELHLPGIKTFQYFKMNAALMEKSEEEAARYAKLQKDPEMLAFHGKHSDGNNFSEADADAAIALLNENFVKMEQAISEGGWLVGATYTLADISWSPTITTLTGGGFDFTDYPNIQDWYERIRQRPQFEKAVIEWRKQATYAVNDPTVAK